MATAQVQQVVAAPVHDNTDRVTKAEEKNHDIIIQGPPCTEIGEQASLAKVHDDGGCTDEEGKDEQKVPAADTDEGQRIAQEIEAKLAIQQGPAETEAKETKEGRPRAVKRTEKAAAKGAVVPVDDETDEEVAAPEGGKKKAEKAEAKWAVVPVDDETDNGVFVPVVVDQAPAAAPVAPEETAEAAGAEEATKGGKGDACEEKAHEE